MNNEGIGALRTALFATTSCIAALAAGSVYAQAAGETEAVEEVVITGSRIVRDGFQAPTPVTVMQAEQLRQLAPSNLADGLNQLPQFRGSQNPNTGGGNAAGRNEPGANLLSLRNLLPQRTLVLLDGRRFIASSEGDVVDINTLPQTLIQRAEVVTGGASAAYGSDAVAGVVNFILDKKYTGFKTSVQAGVSMYGDAIMHKESLTFGSELFGGRGHVIMAGEYSSKAGVGPYDTKREWTQRNGGIYSNPACTVVSGVTTCPTGQPQLLTFKDGVTGSGFTLGGLIITGPAGLLNQQFVAGGGITPFQFGPASEVSSTLQHGGEGFLDKQNLTAGLDYYNLFMRTNYELTDHTNLFLEASYGEAKGEWEQYYNYTLTAAAPTIFASNAFLQPDVASILNAAAFTGSASSACRVATGQAASSAVFAANDGARCFKVGRIHSESMVGASTQKRLTRITFGAEGDLPNGWTYNAYYTYGDIYSIKTYENVLNNNRFYAAVDAIKRTDNGRVECAVIVPTAARPANYVGAAYNAAIAAKYTACQPFNLFGVGAPSAGSLDYIAYDESRYLKRGQRNAAANIGGELPDWTQFGYAPPSFSAGIEYRKEIIELTTDPDTVALTDFTGVRGGLPGRQGLSGPFIFGNYQPFVGGGGEKTYNTKEAYLELDLPVFKDMPAINRLDFNAAYRLVNYSNSGKVDTWKIGVLYEPIPDVRLRATRSRDIRGPAADDLFGGQGQGSAVGTSPFTNLPIPILSRSGGNPNLLPEKADTTTYGIVLTPSFVPGLRASIDWYNIEINGAIAVPATTLITKLCAEQGQLCQYITAKPDGATYQTATELLVQATLINLNKLTVNGVDVEVSYNHDLGPGQLGIRLFGVYQPHNIQEVPGSKPVDYAGEIGIGANPKLTGTLGINYAVGPWVFDIQERYIGSGIQNALYVTGVDIADNRVAAAYYTDISARLKFGEDERYEGFITINDLFNLDPPFSNPEGPSKPRQANANKALYNPLGRYFTVGLRWKI